MEDGHCGDEKYHGDQLEMLTLTLVFVFALQVQAPACNEKQGKAHTLLIIFQPNSPNGGRCKNTEGANGSPNQTTLNLSCDGSARRNIHHTRLDDQETLKTSSTSVICPVARPTLGHDNCNLPPCRHIDIVHIPWKVAFLAHRASAVMAIEAHWVPTATSVMAFFASKTMSQDNLLGCTDWIMEVITSSARTIQMVHVAVAFAPDVRLLVQLFNGTGRLLRQREIDSVVIGVDENDVAA
jgi:hypothetical protein